MGFDETIDRFETLLWERRQICLIVFVFRLLFLHHSLMQYSLRNLSRLGSANIFFKSYKTDSESSESKI
jgi:hypothetical protein